MFPNVCFLSSPIEVNFNRMKPFPLCWKGINGKRLQRYQLLECDWLIVWLRMVHWIIASVLRLTNLTLFGMTQWVRLWGSVKFACMCVLKIGWENEWFIVGDRLNLTCTHTHREQTPLWLFSPRCSPSFPLIFHQGQFFYPRFSCHTFPQPHWAIRVIRNRWK